MKLPVPLLRPSDPFPDPSAANRDGLVAITTDLTAERLLEAYPKGIFPWTENPVTWWSPDPRGVLPLDQLHVPRRLERTIRSGKFRCTINQAFREVIRGCAEPAPGREQSWIGPTFIQAYTELHNRGQAVSYEAWQGDQLAGGLYGVRIGKFFAGESMFTRTRDASSAALVFAARALREEECRLFDLQMVTPHTARFGAVEISRLEYLRLLREAVRERDT
ncbi:MAG: leucyl/phenylalanyl-tRNA--protein transferase [Verrucomicrobia bacterium]|nr:leucyl/phenylalanyl-tRNA--protein transferase [Verrucomicrobiota bacterium]NDD57392.1 leucyl/phenylalanyl-tRNA--protein transferase [Verrucomicrobiota bacterium]